MRCLMHLADQALFNRYGRWRAREIVGAHIGQRERAAARQLWAILPLVHRQCVLVYTDF